MMRTILRNFSPRVCGGAGNGPFQEGGVLVPSSEVVQMGKSITMEGEIKSAVDILKNIEQEKGFEARSQFCIYLSTMAASYPDLSKKRTRL